MMGGMTQLVRTFRQERLHGVGAAAQSRILSARTNANGWLDEVRLQDE